jgi:GT2 family glycosyltransferase
MTVKPGLPSVTVIIPAFSMERWDKLVKSVDGARAQSHQAEEIVVTIDHNPELLERSALHWVDARSPTVRVVDGSGDHSDDLERALHGAVHGRHRRFGAGAARNTAARTATGQILAFIDDDAWPEHDWLEKLVAPYVHNGVVATGGQPTPEYETARPWWFPPEFDWVFGCAYKGLPTEVAPLRHLIGANMSVRRTAFWEIGGFHSIDFDDLDLCQRIAHAFGAESLFYVPGSTVHHYVTAQRVSWSYFWRRCFYVNRYKVAAFQDMGEAANLTAEREFVLRFVKESLARLARAARNLSGADAGRVATGALGITLAGLGNLTGRLDALRQRRTAATTTPVDNCA